MDRERLKFIIALVITGGYVVLVGALIIATISTDFERVDAVEIIEEISKVMAGFIGLIIGFYFSRGQTERVNATEPADTDAGPPPTSKDRS